MLDPRLRRCSVVALALALLLAPALGGAQPRGDGRDVDEAPPPYALELDPTGGAAASPTELLVPAAALPALAVRVLTGVGLQTPSGSVGAAQPHLAAELGLGSGVTVAAGSRWFGGDAGEASVLNGLTPFAQVRLALFGAPDGRGLLGGGSLTCKRIGYRDGESELEAAFALDYRTRLFEVGGNAVFGQSLAEAGEHDLELRAYAGVRPVPRLLVGVAGQVRGDIGEEEGGEAAARPAGRSELDVQVGGLGSLTVGSWQVGTLVGATTVGLRGRVGLLAELFGEVRFGAASTRRRA